MKRILEWLKSLPWIKIAPFGGVVFGVVLFIVLSLTTQNDTVNKRELQGGLITRFPGDPVVFFDETKPDSGIILSWHDNIAELKTGETTTLKLDAQLYPITVADRELTFKSSAPECAEIDGEGNIIAKKTGSVEITVENTATGESAKAYLQIIQPVEGFYIHNSSINVYTSDTGVRIVPVIYPETASNTTVRWYSKNTKIVQVDQTGHLKPISTGIAEVVGTTADGEYVAKCFVNVINKVIRVENVRILNKDKTEIEQGESLRLLASVFPENARNKYVTWESSDSEILSITKAGTVKGMMPGNVTVYAKSSDGAYDSLDITVKEKQTTVAEQEIPQQNVSGGVTYTSYNLTLDEMLEIQMKTSPKFNDGTGLKIAEPGRTRLYLDPNEFYLGAYKYQFMDLSFFSGIEREKLVAYLDGKGILSGQADTFIAAAKQYNINELYLIAHACLETGYGTSKLSTGVEYNGVRVYNMFGIGAFDSDAVGTGSKKAYYEGWTTPQSAIMGGAKWISENYINSAEQRQNTLYKMRWNPDNPGQHLYAGDISWAVTQATIMEKIFADFGDTNIRYEIPVYAGALAPTVETENVMSVTW